MAGRVLVAQKTSNRVLGGPSTLFECAGSRLQDMRSTRGKLTSQSASFRASRRWIDLALVNSPALHHNWGRKLDKGAVKP
jgi:hypothetical protein